MMTGGTPHFGKPRNVKETIEGLAKQDPVRAWQGQRRVDQTTD